MPGVGLGQANVPQQPVPPAGDIKTMGQLPQVFTGNHTRVDNFIKEVKGYLWLNQDMAGFDLPMKKIAFTLMLIKGANTTGWTRDIGTFMDGLDPGDNILELWTQFLVKFGQQFQDTQKEDWARAQLEGLHMNFPEIDTYIAKFEELAWQAGYTMGNHKMVHTFVKGLMWSVMKEVFKPLHVTMYQEIKQKAIDCTQLWVLLDNILHARNQGNRGFQGNAFQGFQWGNAQRQPFFNWPNEQGNRGQQNPQRQYNLSNAPPWMNNQLVPMDVG
jgi:hypothetical protein